MKKILLGAAALIVAFSVYAKNNKVKVIHNGHVIEVSENAVSAHLGHGDQLADPPPPPPPPPPPTGNDEGGVIV